LRSTVACGLLALFVCTANAQEPAFPAVREGDAWSFAYAEVTPGAKAKPGSVHRKAEWATKVGERAVTDFNPDIASDRQIVDVKSQMPVDVCVADAVNGFPILTGARCAEVPEPGASWTARYQEGAAQVRLTFRYLGREKVTVPAGTFEAYRFDCEQRVTELNRVEDTQHSYWYVPLVRGMAQIVDVLPVRSGGKRTWRVQLTAFTSK
jgi:hypothetical protein